MSILDKVKDYCSNLLKEIKQVRKENIKEFVVNRYKFIVSLVLILFLIGGYSIGRINTSKSYIITKLEVALKEGKANKLSSLVKVNGKKVKSSSLKPLIDYYEDESNKVDGLVRDIKETGKGDNLTLIEEDKIFGSSYYLELNTYNLKIESNFDDGVFDLNGKDKIKSGATFRGIMPGVYNVKGTLETDYQNIETEKELLIMKDEVVNIDFNAVNISVTSEYNDAKVFINDKDSNKTVEEFKEYGPFPTDGSVNLHLEREFPWGTISGEKISITDTPTINASLDMKNDKMWEDVDETVDLFYKSVFEALNKEDKELISNSTIEAKNKIFDVLEKKYFVFKNKYIIENVDIVKEQSNFTYNEGVYRGTVVVEVNYEVSKSFLGINKSKDTKMFFTKLIYKDDKWVIDDVENFNL